MATKNLNNNKPTLKIKIISLLSIVTLVITDQVIKYFVNVYLKPVGQIDLIHGVIGLEYVENNGGPLGLFDGKIFPLTIIACVCVVVILFVIFSGKVKFGVDYICIVLMAAGGLGNIIDRFYFGYVIDYIKLLFVDFYVFNFADCLVTWSAFYMIFYQVYQIWQESKNKKETQQNG